MIAASVVGFFGFLVELATAAMVIKLGLASWAFWYGHSSGLLSAAGRCDPLETGGASQKKSNRSLAIQNRFATLPRTVLVQLLR
jgi:hypothetical protein